MDPLFTLCTFWISFAFLIALSLYTLYVSTLNVVGIGSIDITFPSSSQRFFDPKNSVVADVGVNINKKVTIS